MSYFRKKFINDKFPWNEFEIVLNRVSLRYTLRKIYYIKFPFHYHKTAYAYDDEHDDLSVLEVLTILLWTIGLTQFYCHGFYRGGKLLNAVISNE